MCLFGVISCPCQLFQLLITKMMLFGQRDIDKGRVRGREREYCALSSIIHSLDNDSGFQIKYNGKLFAT